MYYGIDFRPGFEYSKNDAPYWNGGYANGNESKSHIYSLAPLVGFRLKLNDRLSISTEADFTINWQESSTKKYYIPVSGQFPPLPDDPVVKTKRFYSYFNAPVILFITFDI